MTDKQKTAYTRIGLALASIPCDDFGAEIIWRTIEGIQKKKGKYSIADAASLRASMEKKYKVKIPKPKFGSDADKPDQKTLD